MTTMEALHGTTIQSDAGATADATHGSAPGKPTAAQARNVAEWNRQHANAAGKDAAKFRGSERAQAERDRDRYNRNRHVLAVGATFGGDFCG